MMAKPQIDQQLITKLRAICAGEAGHVTLMAVVVGELFHAVDRFDWVGFYRVVTSGVLKLGPYQGGHGCLVIPFDKGYAVRRRANSKPRLLTICINLRGISPVPRQRNLNWSSRCLIRATI